MRTKLLITTAALLASVAIASAQSPQGGNMDRGGAMQNQGSERGGAGATTPSGKDRQGQAQPGQRKETTGQAPAQSPQREQNAQGKEHGKDLQREKGQQTQREQRGKDQTTGQNPREGGATPSPGQTQREQGQRQQQGQQGDRTGGQAQGGANQAGANTRGGGNVTLTGEQRTKIRETVLLGGNVPRASNVNFAVAVGTTVPTSVHVVEVVPVLVEVHPEWRGYFYFVVNDEIIIVDRSHRIVAVLPV